MEASSYRRAEEKADANAYEFAHNVLSYMNRCNRLVSRYSGA